MTRSSGSSSGCQRTPRTKSLSADSIASTLSSSVAQAVAARTLGDLIHPLVVVALHRRGGRFPPRSRRGTRVRSSPRARPMTRGPAGGARAPADRAGAGRAFRRRRRSGSASLGRRPEAGSRARARPARARSRSDHGRDWSRPSRDAPQPRGSRGRCRRRLPAPARPDDPAVRRARRSRGDPEATSRPFRPRRGSLGSRRAAGAPPARPSRRRSEPSRRLRKLRSGGAACAELSDHRAASRPIACHPGVPGRLVGDSLACHKGEAASAHPSQSRSSASRSRSPWPQRPSSPTGSTTSGPESACPSRWSVCSPPSPPTAPRSPRP